MYENKNFVINHRNNTFTAQKKAHCRNSGRLTIACHMKKSSIYIFCWCTAFQLIEPLRLPALTIACHLNHLISWTNISSVPITSWTNNQWVHYAKKGLMNSKTFTALDLKRILSLCPIDFQILSFNWFTHWRNPKKDILSSISPGARVKRILRSFSFLMHWKEWRNMMNDCCSRGYPEPKSHNYQI